MTEQQQEADQVQVANSQIDNDNMSNSALASTSTPAPVPPPELDPQPPIVSAVASTTEAPEKQASTALPEAPLLPPPRRTVTASPAPAARPTAPAQKSGFLRKLGDSKWGQRATKVSDAVGTRVNNVSEKVGVERFWPTTGDGYLELQKCERVLREFIVVGVPTKEKAVDESGKQKKKTKVLKKLPPNILANAKGIVIFSAFRSGFAPIGGSGGSGVIMIRNPDRNWSAPAFIAPNNLSGGFLFGLDAFNAIIILNSDEAVQGFKSHQFTLGAEIGVVAGPLGAGAGVDSGLTAGSRGAPIYTYVASKGFYAGVELVGQVFVEREEENEIVYGRKGIRSIDILEGRVTPVPEAQPLHQLLHDAETGQAQGPALERVVSEEAEKTPLA